MAKSVRATGRFDLRVTILRRVLGSPGTNNEPTETFPDPNVAVEEVAAVAAGSHDYYASRENLSAGETIAQSVKEALGSMKLRIKGRAIPVAAADRLKVKATGEVFNVIGVMRESADTILMVERYHPQTVGQ